MRGCVFVWPERSLHIHTVARLLTALLFGALGLAGGPHLSHCLPLFTGTYLFICTTLQTGNVGTICFLLSMVPLPVLSWEDLLYVGDQVFLAVALSMRLSLAFTT